MTQSALPNYQTCADLLRKNNIAVSIAELHGLLSGMLCAGLDDKNNWLIYLYDYTNQGEAWSNNAKAMAESLFSQTSTSLNNELMDFALLQPDEDAPLSEQAQALADWVSAFLAGFGIAGKTQAPSSDSKEILQDLAQIAQLGIDEEEDDIQQLELLMEIREHVRICALSLYADNLLGIKTKPSRALH